MTSGWPQGPVSSMISFSINSAIPNRSREFQAFYHPKVAARNSQERFEISEKERLAILSHMFPLGPLPTSREAWIISCADKFCATAELCCLPVGFAREGPHCSGGPA